MTVHHLGTVFAHGLQVVDLALQERYLGFQVLILWITNKHTHTSEKDNKSGGEPKGTESMERTRKLLRRYKGRKCETDIIRQTQTHKDSY